MILLRVLALLLWLSACGGATAPAKDARTHSPARTPSAKAAPVRPSLPAGRRRSTSVREGEVIGELMGIAERVRGLRFVQAVPVLIEDRDRITAYIESQLEEEELERAQVVYTALGLLAPDLDVRSLLLRLMGEQVVGYYDVDAKHLVVRDDIMRAFGRGEDADENAELAEARIVLVHELVHALQDQRLGLSEHIEEERDTDADNAFHALVEGDATLAMIGYSLERERIPLSRLTKNPAQVQQFSEVVRRSPLAGTELEQAPEIVRVPLLSAYVDGLQFCASLHGSGGFAAIDRAHASPPVSTEQVLHPERFAMHDLPETLRLPDLPKLTAAGYELIREDTLGELEMRVYFGLGASELDATRAAAGWDGDRLRVYRAPGQPPAVIWLSVWDEEQDAVEAEVAARHALQHPGAPAAARCDVARKGTRLLIVRDLAKPLRAALPELLLSPPVASR